MVMINFAKSSPFGGTGQQLESWSGALVIAATVAVEGRRWIFVNQGTRRSDPWVNGTGCFYRADELTDVEMIIRGDSSNVAAGAAIVETVWWTERCHDLARELAAAQVERDNTAVELQHIKRLHPPTSVTGRRGRSGTAVGQS